MSHAVQGLAPCFPFPLASTGVRHLVGGKGKLRHWRHKATPGEPRSHAHSGWADTKKDKQAGREGLGFPIYLASPRLPPCLARGATAEEVAKCR